MAKFQDWLAADGTIFESQAPHLKVIPDTQDRTSVIHEWNFIISLFDVFKQIQVFDAAMNL